MWIVHDQWRNGSGLLTESGAILAGRAVVDMVTMFHRTLTEGLGATASNNAQRLAVTQVTQVVVQRLGACVRALIEADRAKGSFATHRKIGRAIDHARILVDAIGLFVVVSEPIADRVIRVTEALSRKGKPAPALSVAHGVAMSRIANDLEMLAATRSGDTPDRTGWFPDMTGNLDHLAIADAAGRDRSSHTRFGSARRSTAISTTGSPTARRCGCLWRSATSSMRA